MSREGSLDLLQEVEDNLEIMKKNQQVRPVKVKSMLEHLRSALEYVANDTYDKYIKTTTLERPKIYFPYGNPKFIDSFFTKKLNVDPPQSSPLYKVFTSIQGYSTGDTWLEMMCNLTNEVKHRQPIPLDEDNIIKDIDVSVDGFSMIKASNSANITFKNNYINGKKLEDFTFKDGKLEKTGNGIPLNIAITQEKKIRFHGEEHEVIPFIELCLKNIRAFVNEAHDALDNV
ncbi:hypothetical protein NYD80_000679 [Cronobacter sakazakii]|uniref:hypothetical protein n=1 Tax=Cronobacter sakazakii TaxID=28141 RepID=UPI000A18AD6F|nr:hypothetical protein [Cronobacter sakazakii]EJR0494280.1 hypothetical protein [Cronobacter sakazakii]EKA1098298.1 hypothetical protein [Cronobacter sakazakii]EKK4062521.1 hypothetical protein [Cronobacter sakazakii]KAB0854585.1 hypothetical protein FZI13_14895 [Cronobacter sakazakii]MBF4919240.1 hypothetical protein [Cronobacter sakazakii]